MKNSKQTIGQRIKELRELKGLTQAQLGELVFVTDKTVSKWEKDKSEPDSNSLVLLAEKLGVTLDYLLTGSEPDVENESISRIELACREDNIALLNGIDFEAFDDKGKNIDYYVKKYKAKNIRHFLIDWRIDKTIKEGQIRKRYNILAVPKGLEGDDNLCLLAWDGPYSKAAEKCAEFEKDGFHHFKVLRTVDVNETIEKDYQYFFCKFLGDDGQTKMVFSTAIFDDMESGVLELTIWRDKTFKENKHVDGKLVPDYHPLSDCEHHGCYYIKPDVLKTFMDLLSELKVKDWENRHWGAAIYGLFYVLKDEPKDDDLACHKFYVAPGREVYAKFIKGLQKLLLDTLTTSAYKKFVKYFDTKYIPYCRYNVPLCESRQLFKVIEEEMESIKQKHFVDL